MIDTIIGDPIPLVYKEENFQLNILYDGNTPFTFGTKLRKAEGLYQYLIKSGYSAIQLVGDPNSNYLAAFTYYFFIKKIPVFSLHISHSGYRSGNRILSERFSSKFINLPHYEDVFFSSIYPQFYKDHENSKLEQASKNIFVIPRWGITPFAVNNIQSMINNILNIYKINTIYLDIGSGLTYLSFLNNSNLADTQVVGICIGLPKIKMVKYLNQLEFQLFGKISNYDLIDPSGDKGFGRTKEDDLLIIKKLRNHKVYLDPIYSVKAFKTIMSIEKNLNREGVFYLHQGGLLSGINRVR